MKSPLPLLLVTVFLNIAGFSLILPLLPFYGTEFGASSFAIACLFAAYSLGNIGGEIFWGRRSDAMGRRSVLIMTTAGAALSYVAFAFAPGLMAAILIRIVSGFFGGTLGVCQSVIADITPPESRAKNMGYFGAAFNLGFALGPAIGGLLASPEAGLEGFRAPIFAAAALAAAAALQLIWWMQGDRAFRQSDTTLATATRLTPGTVRAFEPPHTGTNYPMRKWSSGSGVATRAACVSWPLPWATACHSHC